MGRERREQRRGSWRGQGVRYSHGAVGKEAVTTAGAGISEVSEDSVFFNAIAPGKIQG